MAIKKLEWTFPKKEIFFLRIEMISVLALAILVFLFSYLQVKSIFYSLIFTLVFIGLYVVSSYLVQVIRVVEEKYKISPTHFEVIRKTRFKTKKEKVHLKKINFHKLDKLLLGGYMLSEKGKHLLFFNNLDELKKFEKFVRKFIKNR